MTMKNPLIIALDVDTLEEASALADKLGAYVGAFKVGMQLYNAQGPEAIHLLRRKDIPVFIDLKLHDIPNTVAGATRVLTGHGAAIINVHAAGGKTMMEKAVQATHDEADKLGISRPLLVAVTVLTSIDQTAFNNEVGIPDSIRQHVVHWARLAMEAGMDGVVASPHEIAAIRQACGDDFVIITPGVRPAGAAVDDQKRVMTPGEAVRLGATYLVVGRPITAAAEPVRAAQAILAELNHN